MSGVTVATMSRSMSFAVDAGLRERGRARGQREVGERLLLRGDAPLADAGALEDPLVGGVDVLRELVVRDHAVRHVAAEPGDRDVHAGLPAPITARPRRRR